MKMPTTGIWFFVGLVLVFPCPWYMVAVGGLLPLPVIMAYGADGPVMLAFSAVHAVLYLWLFWLLARRVDAMARARSIRPAVAGALMLAGFVALGFAPIYGSGDNLLAGNKLKYNAYEIYQDTWALATGGLTREAKGLLQELKR
jgi:hypothetical protein